MSFALRSLRSVRPLAVAIAAFVTIAAAPLTPAARFHSKLVKSEPAANDTLTAAPKALKLWFNEKVELRLTTVKLTGAGGAVKLGAVTRDERVKDAPVVAPIPTELAAGSYTVAWSVAGDDGHPTKGTFAFVVKTAK